MLTVLVISSKMMVEIAFWYQVLYLRGASVSGIYLFSTNETVLYFIYFKIENSHSYQ